MLCHTKKRNNAKNTGKMITKYRQIRASAITSSNCDQSKTLAFDSIPKKTEKLLSNPEGNSPMFFFLTLKTSALNF
jgi:hypothetical protein